MLSLPHAQKNYMLLQVRIDLHRGVHRLSRNTLNGADEVAPSRGSKFRFLLTPEQSVFDSVRKGFRAVRSVICEHRSMRRLPCYVEVCPLMGYIEGEGRNQGALFPVVLDDLVPANHMAGRAQEKYPTCEVGHRWRRKSTNRLTDSRHLNEIFFDTLQVFSILRS
jgi:hypothetical protein